MPRNVKQKFPTASRKARQVAKRRGSDTTSLSSVDLSDDGGYSGVDDITDSEDDDEEDVDAVEEEHIMINAWHDRTQGSPRPETLPLQSREEEEKQQPHEDEDGRDDDDAENVAHNEEEEADADVDDDGSWDGIVSEVDEGAGSDYHVTPQRASAERHVRFDVPSSESDSTETEEDEDDEDDGHAGFFPDLFVDQNTLDPSFRREIEQDSDDTSSTLSGGYWDYHGVYEYNPNSDLEVQAIIQELEDESTPGNTPLTLQDAAEVIPASIAGFNEDGQSLDGYDSDGDTTEEEDDPGPRVRKKQRRPSTAAQSDVSDAHEPIKGEQGQPRLGRFNLDRSDRKPIAVVNPITRKMMIFTPHRQRHLDLSPEQFNLPHFDVQSSPMVGSSAHIMMSAMYPSNDLGDFLSTQAMGPAEAFFPFPSEPNTADEDSDAGLDGDDFEGFTGPHGFGSGEGDYAERSLDIDDFITFDVGSNQGDDDDDDPLDDWCRSDAAHSTPARPTTASSDMDMLPHINASNVGAFRRDQINQRLILSEKATQDSLALSSPYNYTTLRGIKSDRFETAAAPLTPMRRQKSRAQHQHQQVNDFSKSPLASASAKRKASGGDNALAGGHKRHRSISDVNSLHL